MQTLEEVESIFSCLSPLLNAPNIGANDALVVKELLTSAGERCLALEDRLGKMRAKAMEPGRTAQSMCNCVCVRL